jgi:hypothetical protein
MAALVSATAAAANSLGANQSTYSASSVAAATSDAGNTVNPLVSAVNSIDYTNNGPIWSTGRTGGVFGHSYSYYSGFDSWTNSLGKTAAVASGATPAFALGGDHTGGLRIVGENGPELEATGASRIFNAAQTRDILSSNNNEELVMELRAMRAELSALRSEQKAANTSIAQNTGKATKLMVKFDNEGTPPVRLAA